MAHTDRIEYKDELGFRDLGPIVKSGGASPIEITCGLRMMNKSEVADAVSTIRMANILGRTKEGENLLAGAYNRMGKSIASGKLDKSFYEAQGHVLGVFDAMFAMAKAEKKNKVGSKSEKVDDKDEFDDVPADPVKERPPEAKTALERAKSHYENKSNPGDDELDEVSFEPVPDDDYGYEDELDDAPIYEPQEDVMNDARARTMNGIMSDAMKKEMIQAIRKRYALLRPISDIPAGTLTDEDLAELDDIDAYRSDAGLDPLFNNSDYGLDAASWRDDVIGPDDAAALARDLGNYSTQFPDKV